MNTSKKKRSTGIYILLIFMILVLGGFAAYPYLQELLLEKQMVVTPAQDTPPSAQNISLSPQEQEKLATEAQGYEMFLKQEPDNQTALRGLLEVRLKQGDIQGAVIPLERLTQLNSQQVDYQILLAQTKQHLEDYEASA
jgi:cytochrome c-type biogenesis protein CcmH/NrfG